MSESDPIDLSPALRQTTPASTPGTVSASPSGPPAARAGRTVITFTRRELNTILSLYGRHVAAGTWRDYAIDMERDHAAFSVFRHASEMPLYRIEKWPALARRQGMFKVVAASGHILRRGHELAVVLRVLEPKRQLAVV